MKNILLTLIVLSFSAISTYALEPLIIEPLYGNGNTQVTAPVNNNVQNTQTVEVPAATEVSATPKTPQYPPNMVPQNAAAEGLPVTRKTPSTRVRIETKQGSRTNTQWNPGGKGTRSYF